MCQWAGVACSDLPCGCQVSPRQGGTLDIRYRTNFASTSTFSPWPPPSLYTPRDSLEAEVTQGFLVTPRGKPSGKCVSWQGVTLRRPTAAPEIRVEAEQLRGGGRGRGGRDVCLKGQVLCQAWSSQGRMPLSSFLRGSHGTEAGGQPKSLSWRKHPM